jgi:hypothetical protein
MDDNIVKFPGVEEVEYTELEGLFGDHPNLLNVYEAAKERDFDHVIIIGTYEDKENTYFSSSNPDPAKIMWDIEKAKFMLLNSFMAFADNPYDEDE